MSNCRQKFDDEFRKNAVRLSYASSKTIREVVEDLGLPRVCCTVGANVLPPRGIRQSMRPIVLAGTMDS